MRNKIILAFLSLLIFDICLTAIVYGGLVVSVISLVIMLAVTVAIVNRLLES